MSFRYANVGEIIPFVKILKDYVSDEINKVNLTGLITTLNLFKNSFDRRFSQYLNDDNCIFATFLDPRHKNAFDDESEESELYIFHAFLRFIVKKCLVFYH